jgi:hypothetical protein
MNDTYRIIMVNKWNRTRGSIMKRSICLAVRGRAKCKIGEEGGLASGKLQKNLSKNSSYLTSPLRDPIQKEANAGTYNGCKCYYYELRTGMSMMQVCMAWQR